MKPFCRLLSFSALLSLFCLLPAAAIDLAGAGGWSETVTAADLTAGAGTDLLATYTSAADALVFSVGNCLDPSDAWRVDVRRGDVTWASQLSLSVRRTGEGTGLGVINGGLDYLPVGTSDVAFFSGAGDRLGIPVQVQVGGVSIQVEPGSYSTTLILTVVDIL